MMYRVCKIRCYPNQTQKKIINRILGICRWARNQYIARNREVYEKEKNFLSGYEFSKELNHLKKTNLEYEWVKECSSKALKDAIMIQERAYRNFFKRFKCGKPCSLPHFISRKKIRLESFYFIKDNIHFDTGIWHKIKIPILGYIRINERLYLPDNDLVSSGRIIKDNDKYYLMFIYKTKEKELNKNSFGIGIDLGVKHYASVYTSEDKSYHIKSFRHEKKYQKYKERKKALQRIISKKAEINYQKRYQKWLSSHPEESLSDTTKNIMKGESYNTSKIMKINRKLRRVSRKIVNIRQDFIKKLVYFFVVKTKPQYIAIEDLDISEMLSNETDLNHKHELHELLSESNLSYFRILLQQKCDEYDMELRLVDRYFPSSKICSKCGKKKNLLSLSERTFHCGYCGNKMDRDLNAAKNLVFTEKYSYA